jgi:hypothetical protein
MAHALTGRAHTVAADTMFGAPGTQHIDNNLPTDSAHHMHQLHPYVMAHSGRLPPAKEVMQSLPHLSVSNWMAALSGQSLRNLSVYQNNVAPQVSQFWQSVAAKSNKPGEETERSASVRETAPSKGSVASDLLATFTSPVYGKLTVVPRFSLGSVHTAVSCELRRTS